MSLRDKIKVPYATIPISDDDDFMVRGLSLRDVGVLTQRHHQMLSAMFAEVMVAQGKGEDFGADTIAAKLPDLLSRAPDLVCDVIAVSSGDIGDSDVIALLPIPVQVSALEKVFSLTFRTEADLKNVLETVMRGLKSMTRQLESLNS